MKKHLLILLAALLLMAVEAKSQITLQPNTLEVFSYIYGEGPSERQQIVVSANEVSTINVVCDNSYFLVSIDGETYSTLCELNYNIFITTQTIYIRMVSDLDANDYSGGILFTDQDGVADSVHIDCSGHVDKAHVATPTFDPIHGLYHGPLHVTISCETEGAIIRYTRDGSEPNDQSSEYNPEDTIVLYESETIKAKAWKDDQNHEPSDVATENYFIQYRIQAQVLPEGFGEIENSITPYDQYHYSGDTLELHARPVNDNYYFVNWTENGSEVCGTPDYEFIVSKDCDIKANFRVNNGVINTNVYPDGAGYVTIEGSYEIGQTAQLTAIPNPCYIFKQWNDGVIDNPRNIEVAQTNDYTAIFELANYAIVGLSNNEIWGHVIGGGSAFHCGDVATLEAIPEEGYEFDNWKKNDTVVSTSPTYSFNVTGDATYIAHFMEIPVTYYTITIVVEPEDAGLVTEGSGTVIENGQYPEGSSIMLTAVASDDFIFDHWSDNITESSRLVQVNDNMNFTAFFPQRRISIEVPDTICSGESLTLIEPQLLLPPTHTEWQLSQTNDFESYEVYNNESLHANYNGWYLRYCAKYLMVSIYSNIVQITVNSLESLTLEGNESVDTHQEVDYQIIDSINNYANYSYDWSVSDSQADITIVDNGCKVIWKTPGVQEVSVMVTDTMTSCTNTYTLSVEVLSCIDENDIHNIVAKSYADSIKYILIYPNPNPNNTYTFQWYRNDTLIQYANKQYYYKPGGLPDGNYKVRISIFKDERCSAFSPVFLVENNQNHHPSSRLSIYPNPAHSNDELFIVNGSENEAQLTIYSIDGRLLHSQTVSGSQTSINVCLPQGVYVAHISDQSGFVKVEKIIIQ